MNKRLLNNNSNIDFSSLEARIENTLQNKTYSTMKMFETPKANYFNLSIIQLLSFKNEEFVEACFCTILGRESDKGSLNHYLNKMDQGYDPRAIIAFLRYSMEGKNRFKDNNHNLPSLTKYRMFSLPLIGKLIVKALPFYQRIKNR
jgi:hypothetical protein